jgi:hypothetical protein
VGERSCQEAEEGRERKSGEKGVTSKPRGGVGEEEDVRKE